MRHLSHGEKAIAVANLIGVMDLPRRSVNLGGQYVALVIPADEGTRFVIGTAMSHGGCGAGTHLPLTRGQATQLRDALTWALDRAVPASSDKR